MAISCLSFLALGLVTAAIGPALPELASNTSSSLAVVGGLFTVLFLGALIAQLLAGPLVDRFGERIPLVVGLILVGFGIFGVIGIRQVVPMLILGALLGLGHGTVDIGTNILVAETHPERRTSALNLLNLFFGLGAFLGPALSGLSLGLWGTALPILGLGGLLFLAMIIPVAVREKRQITLSPEDNAVAPSLVFRSPILWILGILLLVYVGAENGEGGWTTTYLERNAAMATASAALVTAGYWLALTAGRIVATFAGARIPSRPLLVSSIGVACLGGALLVLGTHDTVISIAGTLILGFGYGPIFPTTMAIATAIFRRGTGTAASIIIAMGSLGGMILPGVQGILLEQSGLASVLLIALAAVAMLVCYLVFVWLESRLDSAQSSNHRAVLPLR